jgi:hypothetical protein
MDGPSSPRRPSGPSERAPAGVPASSPAAAATAAVTAAADAPPVSRARPREWLEMQQHEHNEVCNKVNLDDPARRLSWELLYRTYQRGVGDGVRRRARAWPCRGKC